jgi:hypothetical protein
MYESPIVRENAVCNSCLTEVVRIRVSLVCAKCKTPFQTKVLAINKDKYTDKWLCPLCVSNGAPKTEVHNKRDCAELNCPECRVKRGVCSQPKLNCTLSRGFVPFGNGDLYSTRKECTILSVHCIDKDRDDIHCFGYTPLYKSEYSISPSNFVIIKQRVGSRKQFVTNIIVYRYNQGGRKFEVALNKKFDRGADWILPVKDFLLGRQAVACGQKV